MTSPCRNFVMTAAAAWVMIGTIAYGDTALFDGASERGGLAAILSALIFFCLVCANCDTHAPSGRYYVPVLGAFMCTTVLSCTTGGYANEQRRLFWCYSGIFIGFLAEKMTGLYERHVWRPSLKEREELEARWEERLQMARVSAMENRQQIERLRDRQGERAAPNLDGRAGDGMGACGTAKTSKTKTDLPI